MAEERNENSRRNLLRSTLVAISTATLGSGVRPLFGDWELSNAAQASAQPQRFLTESERSFLKAAVGRFIPCDEHEPGAVDAGVVDYIDLQMAGPRALREQMYRHDPFRKGTPTQGYQLLV